MNRQSNEVLQEREKNLARIEKLRLIDDDFFSEVLDGKREAVGYILRILLDRDDLVVTETKSQVVYRSATKRSISLDIKAVDAENEYFDVEIQRADRGTGARRARFHGSMIDRDLLDKNADFEILPESYIIFITENDKYRQGEPLYHIDRTIKECKHEAFGDGLHIIYVNGEYQNSDTKIGRLMHDFYCEKSEDMYSEVLANEVKYFKETEGGRTRMCRILEEMCEEVAERATKETEERMAKENAEAKRKTAQTLLTLNKLSFEEISMSTGLPVEIVEELANQKTA